jgi:hypothetical protein
MAMCDSTTHHANALITAQNHGTILVMAAWFLACVLVGLKKAILSMDPF